MALDRLTEVKGQQKKKERFIFTLLEKWRMDAQESVSLMRIIQQVPLLQIYDLLFGESSPRRHHIGNASRHALY